MCSEKSKKETEGAAVRAALYARCSTHDKGQDPELQLAPLREYSQRRNFTITGEYVDNALACRILFPVTVHLDSASKIMGRTI